MRIDIHERRGFTRVRTRLSALWQRRGEQIDAVLRDLTLEGAWLSCADPPALGEEARLALPDETAGAVQLRALVVRSLVTSEGPGFAIAFVKPDPDTRRAIANHLLLAASRGGPARSAARRPDAQVPRARSRRSR